MSNKQFTRATRHFASLENESQFSIECTPKQLTITSQVNKKEGYPDFSYRQLPSGKGFNEKEILAGEGIWINHRSPRQLDKVFTRYPSNSLTNLPPLQPTSDLISMFMTHGGQLRVKQSLFASSRLSTVDYFLQPILDKTDIDYLIVKMSKWARNIDSFRSYADKEDPGVHVLWEKYKEWKEKSFEKGGMDGSTPLRIFDVEMIDLCEYQFGPQNEEGVGLRITYSKKYATIEHIQMVIAIIFGLRENEHLVTKEESKLIQFRSPLPLLPFFHGVMNVQHCPFSTPKISSTTV